MNQRNFLSHHVHTVPATATGRNQVDRQIELINTDFQSKSEGVLADGDNSDVRYPDVARYTKAIPMKHWYRTVDPYKLPNRARAPSVLRQTNQLAPVTRVMEK